jgi:hypothetical protein
MSLETIIKWKGEFGCFGKNMNPLQYINLIIDNH